jgi:hypothetical protein
MKVTVNIIVTKFATVTTEIFATTIVTVPEPSVANGNAGSGPPAIVAIATMTAAAASGLVIEDITAIVTTRTGSRTVRLRRLGRHAV